MLTASKREQIIELEESLRREYQVKLDAMAAEIERGQQESQQLQATIDTQRAAKLFAKFNVPLSGYIVNRVIPTELRDQKIPDYLRNRLEMQKRYLEKIDTIFGAEVLARVPEFERDIAGLPMIEKMAHAMFGDF